MNLQPKIPPHSSEAEVCVLGGLMLDAAVAGDVIELVKVDDFYAEAHRIVYAAIVSLFGLGKAIDFLTVIEDLRKADSLDAAGGFAYVAGLAHNSSSAANVTAYAGIVRDRARLRSLISAGSEIATMGFSPDGREIGDLIDIAEQRIFAIREGAKARDEHIAEIGGLLDEVDCDIEAASRRNPGEVAGLTTGLADLDEKINGLREGQLIIVAGRPGMGKTTLAANIGDRVCDRGGSVLFFSMEMPGKELAMRSLANASSVSIDSIIKGRLTQDQRDAITYASGDIRGRRLTIDASPALSPLEVRARARRHASKRGVDLIIVDYLQLMRVPGNRGTRNDEIGEISGSLKALAKELSIPVIALSQLNRGVENRDNKRPRMADLRESGSIEQDADVILFVYRDEVYNKKTAEAGTAEILVEKQRNGALGMIRAAYVGEFSRFSNLAHDWEPQSQSDDDQSGKSEKRGFSRRAPTRHWQDEAA